LTFQVSSNHVCGFKSCVWIQIMCGFKSCVDSNHVCGFKSCAWIQIMCGFKSCVDSNHVWIQIMCGFKSCVWLQIICEWTGANAQRLGLYNIGPLDHQSVVNAAAVGLAPGSFYFSFIFSSLFSGFPHILPMGSPALF
jgi:hypothetical protein